MSNIDFKTQGVMRYPHLVTASASPEYPDNEAWGVNILVKVGTVEHSELMKCVNQIINDDFGGTLPAGANNCVTALTGDLDGWVSLNIKQPVKINSGEFKGRANDRPTLVDENHQPILDDSEIQHGNIAFVAGRLQGYTRGAGGISCYLRGTMVTNQRGELDPADLSSRPTSRDLFGGMTPSSVSVNPNPITATSTPITGAVPIPAKVVPTSPSSGKVMTAKALGATYESFIDLGWTDVTLIEHGMMEPPGGDMPF